jgi:cation transporter-like permease
MVQGKKEVIALIPVMSDLRGDILGSSASRLNTILHLGLVAPSTYTLTKLELKPTLAISMVTSIIMSIVSFIYTMRMLGEPLNLEEMVSIGFLSSMMATLTLLPYIALVTSVVFKRGFDPGNLLPTLVTTVGDLATLPFLVIAFILVASTPSNITPLLFLTVTSISLAFYTASHFYGGSRIRRILRERLLILFLLTITEPLVGAFLAWLEEGLAEMRLIHLATSFIGVNGALASIAGVRLSATLHIYGTEGLTGRFTVIAQDVALASIPGALLISLVGYTTQTLIGESTLGLTAMIAVVATATIVHIAIGLISALVVSIGSYKLGLDPNNAAIPVITTIMDITGIPILYVTGLLVLG